jgi:hypothetical protein
MQLIEPQMLLLQWALDHYPVWTLPILGILAGWSLRNSKGREQRPRRNWFLHLQVGGDELYAQNEIAKHERHLSQKSKESVK